MKKRAWTLIETLVALAIIGIMSGLCVSIYKPRIIKNRVYIYGVMRNLTKGNVAVYGSKNTLEPDDIDRGAGVFDGYCMNLADSFTLKTSPNCSINASKDDVNMTFPNGATIKGLASDWITATSGDSTFDYKDILVDIDGSKGVNKTWVDQFPLRIYFSNKSKGIIWPANCSSSNPDPAGKSVYCPASGGQDYSMDNKLLLFNVFRQKVASYTNTDTFKVASSLSAAEADCGAYGGTGLYTPAECAQKGGKLFKQCVTETTCFKCSESPSTCPKDYPSYDACMSAIAQFNPDQINCMAFLSKPRSGASFIIEALLGDVDSI